MSEPGKLDSFIIWRDFNSKINLENLSMIPILFLLTTVRKPVNIVGK